MASGFENRSTIVVTTIAVSLIDSKAFASDINSFTVASIAGWKPANFKFVSSKL